MAGPDDIQVEPNPVQGGSDLEVSYGGSEQLYYSVDGGPWNPLPVDSKTGKAKLPVPVGSRWITISDRKLPGVTNIVVEVIETIGWRGTR